CNVRIEPENPVRKECRKHRGGEQRAMGEIDDVQDAIDQRQPKRDEPIHRAGQEPVEDGGNEDDRREQGATTKATAAGAPVFRPLRPVAWGILASPWQTSAGRSPGYPCRVPAY